MKKYLYPLLLSFSLLLLVASSAATNGGAAAPAAAAQFPTWQCSYNAAVPGYGYRISPQPAPITSRQQELFDWFNEYGVSRNPQMRYLRLPVLVLEGEENARAGTFGIAFNPGWFARLGEDISIGILAHELGHVSQAYSIIPMDEVAARYGIEGQADYFAGRILKASGVYTAGQMSRMAEFIRPSTGDDTHAPGPVRARLMQIGWEHAGGTSDDGPVEERRTERRRVRVECQHQAACAHQVACGHRTACAHQMPCAHRMACGHMVPTPYGWRPAHPFDTAHMYDVAHAFDVAHPYDTAHQFDRPHPYDEVEQ